jgi:hypothetical protein
MDETLTSSQLKALGWREWVALPEFNVGLIKAKIDTGAHSSALHAFAIEPYRKAGQRWLMFAIHPKQLCVDEIVECHALIKDRRFVTDSGGHKQRRYIIESQVVIGKNSISAEMSLTNRDNMRFRILIGRTALRGHFMVDPGLSYLQGKPQTQCF